MVDRRIVLKYALTFMMTRVKEDPVSWWPQRQTARYARVASSKSRPPISGHTWSAEGDEIVVLLQVLQPPPSGTLTDGADAICPARLTSPQGRERLSSPQISPHPLHSEPARRGSHRPCRSGHPPTPHPRHRRPASGFRPTAA
jgi:hypothetical protein